MKISGPSLARPLNSLDQVITTDTESSRIQIFRTDGGYRNLTFVATIYRSQLGPTPRIPGNSAERDGSTVSQDQAHVERKLIS